MVDQAGCRVGILGLDHWYSALPLLAAFVGEPRIEVAGIAHDDVARARMVASEAGVGNVTAEPDALISDDTIDAVAIFASTDRTPALCTAAARAHKHVLAAKPVARTLDEATAVVAAVRKAEVHLLPAEAAGLGGRRGPVEAVHALVSEGRLGEVVFARCSISAGLPECWPDDPRPGWFVDPGRCAGGGWVDHAVYQIDRLRWILGREVQSVSGTMATAQHLNLALEDWGSALVRFEGGVLAELRADWFMPTTDMFQSQWEIVGTRGSVRVDDVTHRVTFAEAPPRGGSLALWENVPVPTNYGPDSVATHLADVVTGRAKPLGSVEDAWHNVAVIEAFYAAARSGRQVRVQSA